MKSKEIDTETWKKALSEAVKIGILQAHFSGGEPTARKDLEELVLHASSIGLYTNLMQSYGESIYTNRIELVGTYEFPFKEKIRVDASYSYHHQDSYYGNIKYEAWQEVYFANFLWDKKIGLNHDFFIGYTHRYQTYIDSTLANINEKNFIPGLFIQDEMRLRFNLSVLAGLEN